MSLGMLQAGTIAVLIIHSLMELYKAHRERQRQLAIMRSHDRHHS